MDLVITTDVDLALARNTCRALDQARELTVGAHTWTHGAATLTEWPDGRGAVATNGASEWGDWRGDVLHTEGGERYGRDGTPVLAASSVPTRTYSVEGCGADQMLVSASAEEAAQEAAEWQYGDLGEVTVEWRGTGPGTALAEYEVRVNGELRSRRIVVYEVAEETA